MARFSKYLSVNRIPQPAMAKALGVSQATISRLVLGEVPSMALAQRIEAVTGGEVQLKDWPIHRKAILPQMEVKE